MVWGFFFGRAPTDRAFRSRFPMKNRESSTSVPHAKIGLKIQSIFKTKLQIKNTL